MDLLDVVVEVEVEVSRLADVLGIGTGLSADDIEDRSFFPLLEDQSFQPTFCVQRISGTWRPTSYQL